MTAIIALHESRAMRVFLARRDEPWPVRFGRNIAGLLLTGLVVEVALAPIALFHFHKAGLYGALANVIAIPLTTFVIMPAEALALFFDSVGLGAPFWWVAEQALKGLIALAHAVAGTPGAVATLPVFPRWGFALAIAGGFWLLLWSTRWRRWGAVPLIVGMATLLIQPRPDVLITGDGRHIAAALPDGGYALLRDRAGDYIRDTMAEAAGSTPHSQRSPTSTMSNAIAISAAGATARARRAASSWRRAAATGSRAPTWPVPAPPPMS